MNNAAKLRIATDALIILATLYDDNIWAAAFHRECRGIAQEALEAMGLKRVEIDDPKEPEQLPLFGGKE